MFGARVRRVATNGVITTFAGTGTPGFNSDNQPATTAQLTFPVMLATDPSNNVYIADAGNHRIRKVAAGTGIITTVAGNGVAGYNGDGVGKQINQPIGLFYLNGFLYFTDNLNYRLRRVNLTTLNISTIAGTGVNTSTGNGGPAGLATLDNPVGVVAIGSSALVADGSATIRIVSGIGTANTTINAFAGIGFAPFAGDGGPATSAVISEYFRFATAPNGDLYIADDGNHRIRKVAVSTGTITTVAGTGNNQSNGDGAALSTNITPDSISVDAAGNVWFSENKNALIRKLDVAGGTITTVAGTGIQAFNGDGPVITTNIAPDEITVDPSGNIVIADYKNSRVRKLTVSTGMITTLAGTGSATYNGDGAGAVTNVQPGFVTTDSHGDIYVTDSSDRVRKIAVATNAVTTVMGTGSAADLEPGGMAVDAVGNIYVADFSNNRVRRWDHMTQVVSTVAGTGVGGLAGDGGPATAAQLVLPASLALGAGGRLYVGDEANHRIRMITVAVPQPVITPPAYNPVSPERLLDTRIGVGAPTGTLTAGDTLVLQVTGAGTTSVPASAVAVALNVTVTQPTAAGYLTVWQCGSPQPLASNLNYTAGENIPNLVIAKLGTGGTVCIAGQATTHIVADVNGWFAPSPAYSPVAPERLLDTRTGVGAPAGKLVGASVLTLQVTGAGTTNVPTGASGVALNITVTEPDAAGYLTVWPCDQPQPLASNLNYAAGETIPNLVVAKLSAAGTVCIIGQATTHVVADVNGWFSASASYAPVTPERLLDTRIAVGAAAGPLAAGSTLTLQVTGAGSTHVPASATAAAINITVTNPDADGFLTVWPCGSPQPLASNLNYRRGETIPNLVLATLGTGGTICIAGQATTDIVADINGWFTGAVPG